MTKNLNQEYLELLQTNSEFNKKSNIPPNSSEYKYLQRRLIDFELRLSSEEIIDHAEHLFPQVQKQ